MDRCALPFASRRAWMYTMLSGSRTSAGAAPLCLALTCVLVGLAHGQQSTYLAPVFLWSSASDYVTATAPGVTSRVSYEVLIPCPRTWKLCHRPALLVGSKAVYIEYMSSKWCECG